MVGCKPCWGHSGQTEQCLEPQQRRGTAKEGHPLGCKYEKSLEGSEKSRRRSRRKVSRSLEGSDFMFYQTYWFWLLLKNKILFYRLVDFESHVKTRGWGASSSFQCQGLWKVLIWPRLTVFTTIPCSGRCLGDWQILNRARFPDPTYAPFISSL